MKVSRYWWWLLLAIPVALGVKRLHFDTEILDLLPQDERVVQGLKLYQENFGNARELIVLLRAKTAEAAEEAAASVSQRLRQERGLVASATWEAPWLEHPEQTGELIAYLWLNGPSDAFRDLEKRLRPAELKSLLAATREQLATSMSPMETGQRAYDPYGLTVLPESLERPANLMDQGSNFFASADGTFRIIYVEAASPLASYRECAAWFQSVKREVERAAAGFRADLIAIQYTGRPAFVTEISGNMERDVTASVVGTSLIIAALFWLAHRRWRPMLWLVTLLALILASTFALGGLAFGTINVISMGFAAILLGLAVDYAVVHYQEAVSHPGISIPEVRRAIAPSIFWAAVTTISAFLSLNLGGLPGLAQLGSLIAIGVGLSALVMLFAYLPPLFPERLHSAGSGISQKSRPQIPSEAAGDLFSRWISWRWMGALVTGGLIAGAIGILVWRPPGLDTTPQALRPRHSEAYAALQTMTSVIGVRQEPLCLVIAGQNEKEVAQSLQRVEVVLRRARTRGVAAEFVLPTALWPRLEFQKQNRKTAAVLAGRGGLLRRTAIEEHFAPVSLGLTGKILETWKAAAAGGPVYWPTNEVSRWAFGKLVSRRPGHFLALGLAYPAADVSAMQLYQTLAPELPERTWACGWELLGSSILKKVLDRLWLVLAPMIALVLTSLWLAFRRAGEVLLSLSVLGLSGLCLLSVMSLAGWKWNLMNLMAIPLMLGTGVDYSIFMQLALRRAGGDLHAGYHSVGRALLLCGATAVAGFGSLGWSTLSGMASLGRVCAVAIGANMLISVFLLPRWWNMR